MKTIRVQWVIRRALGLVCVPLLAGGLMVAQQPAPPGQAPAQLLSPDQLDTLVAPVALYPDALLSQVLVAATYPLEIVEAGQWLQQNRQSTGPPTGGCGAPAELGRQRPSPGGLSGRGGDDEPGRPVDNGIGQRVPRAAIGRDGRGAEVARTGASQRQALFHCAADGYDRDTGREGGH